jgi:hypothetical protein
VDPGEVVACLVVQPPDVKPLRGTVKAVAHANLHPCRLIDAVLEQQKVCCGVALFCAYQLNPLKVKLKV